MRNDIFVWKIYKLHFLAPIKRARISSVTHFYIIKQKHKKTSSNQRQRYIRPTKIYYTIHERQTTNGTRLWTGNSLDYYHFRSVENSAIPASAGFYNLAKNLPVFRNVVNWFNCSILGAHIKWLYIFYSQLFIKWQRGRVFIKTTSIPANYKWTILKYYAHYSSLNALIVQVITSAESISRFRCEKGGFESLLCDTDHRGEQTNK